ncbi:hypothetical protein [Candidatus Thiosymbion oneisti]|uniref:hypothetical protein n=1 Tax=Candidatus Thiosymbion oneisti TaxID=589554 RepID=UPI000B7D08AB|nr:hypothetical protein [Candidatus Thiosymbion oneisti]
MGSKQHQDPFTGEPEELSGTAEPGSHPDLPAAEQEVVECLLSEGSVSHEAGGGSRLLEVHTRLSGNNREWKYRVVVVLDGKEVEDPLGAYPTEKHFPRDLGADDEDGGGGSAHRLKVAQHAARCHLDIWTQAHRLLPKKAPRRRYWLWILIILILASAGAAAAYYLLKDRPVVGPSVKDRSPIPPTPTPDCTQTPNHPDCRKGSPMPPSEPPDLEPFFKRES